MARLMYYIPRTYGLEFFLLPCLAFPYLHYVGEFGVVATLFNNAVITLLCGGIAIWRSKVLSKGVGRGAMPLDPIWPALAGAILLFIAALQFILAVTHLSYYRKGDLGVDVFERL